jgi:hypothetical protein
MVAATAFRKRDGSREFTCTGCGAHVFQAIDDGFDFPVCATCRWLDERPFIDKGTADRIRFGST